MEEGMENGTICRLFIENPTTRLVAIGRVYNMKKHHGNEISHDVLKVSIDNVLDGESKIPYEEDEIKIVAQAKGSFLLWPKKLIKLGMDEENGTICRLFLEDPTSRLVAIGKVYNLERHNGNEISPDALKVSIVNTLHGESKVPYKEVEIKTVAEGKDTFLLWPKKLIKVGLDG